MQSLRTSTQLANPLQRSPFVCLIVHLNQNKLKKKIVPLAWHGVAWRGEAGCLRRGLCRSATPQAWKDTPWRDVTRHGCACRHGNVWHGACVSECHETPATAEPPMEPLPHAIWHRVHGVAEGAVYAARRRVMHGSTAYGVVGRGVAEAWRVIAVAWHSRCLVWLGVAWYGMAWHSRSVS